jgi:hypothetical protein
MEGFTGGNLNDNNESIQLPMAQEVTTNQETLQPIDPIAVIIKSFEDNPLQWGKVYFTHHFRIGSPGFHSKIMKEVVANRFFGVAAPRESSKSTLLSFIYPMHQLCFKKRRFIVIVSNTYSKAARTLENMKKEFRDNIALQRDYPITITKDSEGDSIFRWGNGYETRVLCKGAEQMGSVRGEKFGAYRPDLIIIDDIEDDEMVRNPDRRRDLKDLYDEALIPAGEFGLVQVIVVGTILHDDSLMAKIVSKDYYPEYRKLLYRAKNLMPDGTYKSLWHEKWTLYYLDQMEKEKPDVFAKEMQNDPVSGANQVFFKEDFRYWRRDTDKYVLFDENNKIISMGSFKNCKSAIAVDLAWSEKRTADDNVIMGGLLTPEYDLLIYSYIAQKGLRPDFINDYIFSLHTRLRALTGDYTPLGMEKAMRESVAKWDLEKEMRQRKQFITIKKIDWETDKIKRITSALLSRYKQHSIYHYAGMGDLENQLLRFPSGVHDDIVDCEQILSKMFDFSKYLPKPKTDEDEFNWWRDITIKSKKGEVKKPYVLGHKGKKVLSTIPHTVSYR